MSCDKLERVTRALFMVMGALTLAVLLAGLVARWLM